MKRVLKPIVILTAIATIIGCNRVDLVAPTLISPADSAALYSGLTFIWSSGQETEEYVIHVWTGSTDVIQETLTDTTYVMSDSAFSALTYGTYNWAVASKAGSQQEWSETHSFSLSQPGAPVLIAPEDGAVFDAEPPTFVWHADSLNPDYVIRVVFTTDTSTVLEDTLTDTTYTMSAEVFDGLTNGTYSWWIGSVVTNGLILSETRSFSLSKSGAPVLIAPEDGAVFDTEPPTFTWHPDPLEPDYVIRIFTDSTIILQDTISDTSYVMSVSVFDALANGTYSWWVGSVVTNGLILSVTRSFDVDKPGR